MPHPQSKRTKIVPKRRSATVPSWVLRLRELAGPSCREDVENYQAWRNGAEVPGLPLFAECTEKQLCCPLRGGWRRRED